jgi:hypothetical protein
VPGLNPEDEPKVGREHLIRAHPQVLSQRGADSIVLLSLDSGRYYTLEGVGARIWELCDGTRSQRDVGVAISREFDVPLEQVEADLAELIDDLAQEELLAVGG